MSDSADNDVTSELESGAHEAGSELSVFAPSPADQPDTPTLPASPTLPSRSPFAALRTGWQLMKVYYSGLVINGVLISAALLCVVFFILCAASIFSEDADSGNSVLTGVTVFSLSLLCGGYSVRLCKVLNHERAKITEPSREIEELLEGQWVESGVCMFLITLGLLVVGSILRLVHEAIFHYGDQITRMGVHSRHDNYKWIAIYILNGSIERLLAVLCVVFVAYMGMRLLFLFPLIAEGNNFRKACRLSFQMTRGKVLLVTGSFLLYALIINCVFIVAALIAATTQSPWFGLLYVPGVFVILLWTGPLTDCAFVCQYNAFKACLTPIQSDEEMHAH